MLAHVNARLNGATKKEFILWPIPRGHIGTDTSATTASLLLAAWYLVVLSCAFDAKETRTYATFLMSGSRRHELKKFGQIKLRFVLVYCTLFRVTLSSRVCPLLQADNQCKLGGIPHQKPCLT